VGPTRQAGNAGERAWLAAAVLALHPVFWVGGPQLGDRHVPGERDKPQFILFLPQLQPTERPWLRGWVMSPCQCSAPLRCWPRGAVGWSARSGDCGFFCCCRGSYGSCCARCRCLAMALLFFAVPPHWLRAGCQAHGKWPFWVVFFGFPAIWSVTPPCCTAHAGPLYCLSALVAAGCCCPGRSIGPCPSPGLGYWRWAGGRKAAPSFPVGPVLPGLFPGGVVVLLLPPPLNGCYIPAAGCLQEALLISLFGSPCAGHRKGPLALIGPSAWNGQSFKCLGARGDGDCRCLGTNAGRPPIRPNPDFAQALEAQACSLVLALVVGCRCCWFFSLLFKKGPPPCCWARICWASPPAAAGGARPGPLMQGPAQQPPQRSGGGWLDRCQTQRKKLLVIAICDTVGVCVI